MSRTITSPNQHRRYKKSSELPTLETIFSSKAYLLRMCRYDTECTKFLDIGAFISIEKQILFAKKLQYPRMFSNFAW